MSSQHHLNFDSNMKDLDALQRITRRGFMGRLLGGATAGAALLSMGSKAFGKPAWDNHKIYIRSVVHEEIDWDVNRASLHVMVTSQQVDKLLGALEEVSKKKGI